LAPSFDEKSSFDVELPAWDLLDLTCSVPREEETVISKELPELFKGRVSCSHGTGEVAGSGVSLFALFFYISKICRETGIEY
jgi:hypothetical protein